MAENVQYSRQTTGGIAVGNKGISGNPFEEYFGPPNGEIKTGAFDRLASVSDTLPDAYAGQSLFLRDTIEGLVREANEFYTTTMLPWAYTDQQKVKWTVWTLQQDAGGLRAARGRQPHGDPLARRVRTRDHATRSGVHDRARLLEDDRGPGGLRAQRHGHQAVHPGDRELRCVRVYAPTDARQTP